MPIQLKAIKIYLSLSLLLLVSSCSVQKFLPEGKTLYTGSTINLDAENKKNTSELKTKLNSAIDRNTNSKFLGMRLGLYFYYKSQGEKPGFINKFLNKQFGEDPYYFEDLNVDGTEDILNNRLENNGYFGSLINTDIQQDSLKKLTSIKFDIELSKPYRVESYVLDKKMTDTLAIYDEMESSLKDTDIKDNSLFSLNQMKSERERIDTYLKERGYYNFNSEFLIFEADTNQYDNQKFDLYLRLKKKIPEKSLVPYVIDEVYIHTNRSISAEETSKDTTQYEGYNFIQNKVFFKPKRLKPYVLIKPNENYNPQDSRYTSRRLSSLRTYKFVEIDYKEKDSVNDADGKRHLKADIYLSPLNKRSLRFELQAVTKSNNFAGPNLSMVYSNRNVFQGGELLQLSATGGYEQQLFGKTGDQGFSSIQLGLNASLLFPRLIFPIDLSENFKYAMPKTKVSLGLDFLNRSNLYTLGSFSTFLGYIWEVNKYVTHELKPINIEYISLGNTSDEFEQILDNNAFLRRSFEQQFIAGFTYGFSYSEIENQLTDEGLFFGFNYDMAGNLLSLFDTQNTENRNTFLGQEFAQYIKTDIDLRYHLSLDGNKQKLVGRVFAGIGQPLGTTETLPFVKQYFSGGPYSVRAFRIRSLGPGTFSPEDGSNSFFDQSGDIKLEANLEYRFPITEYVNGAFFADAGNVWLTNENEALPGGKFSSDFINEIGAGVGFGLRVDIQSFVLRLDLATPVKEPSSSWNFDTSSPILNFAIGYPF
ncbi:MAG: BamA/TamA family outer membrane protein [Psychroflexus sp.]